MDLKLDFSKKLYVIGLLKNNYQIAQISLRLDILNKIKKTYDVEFYLEVVPTVVYGESTPCLAPSLDVMKFCCDTQTKLDIDLYVDIPDSIYANIKSNW